MLVLAVFTVGDDRNMLLGNMHHYWMAVVGIVGRYNRRDIEI